MRALLLAVLLAACTQRLPTEFNEATLYDLPLQGAELAAVATDGAASARLDPLLLSRVLGRARRAPDPAPGGGRGLLIVARTRDDAEVRLEACRSSGLIAVDGIGWMVADPTDVALWDAELARGLEKARARAASH